MLIFPLICTSCGTQIGSQSLLYVWLRNARFQSRPDPYSEASFREISDMAGLRNDCCWSIVHSTLGLGDMRLGVKMYLADGTLL